LRNQRDKECAMNERIVIPMLAVAAIMLAGVGFTAFATDNPQAAAAMGAAGEAVDAALNDRVETLLKTDVGLVGSRLTAATRGGVVTLAGTVPDEHALRRALDMASGVKGVREVRSTLTIDPPK